MSLVEGYLHLNQAEFSVQCAEAPCAGLCLDTRWQLDRWNSVEAAWPCCSPRVHHCRPRVGFGVGAESWLCSQGGLGVLGTVRGLAGTGHRGRDCSCCTSGTSLCQLPHRAQHIPWHQGYGQAGTALPPQNLPEIPSWGKMNILSLISHKESHKIHFFPPCFT